MAETPRPWLALVSCRSGTSPSAVLSAVIAASAPTDAPASGAACATSGAGTGSTAGGTRFGNFGGRSGPARIWNWTRTSWRCSRRLGSNRRRSSWRRSSSRSGQPRVATTPSSSSGNSSPCTPSSSCGGVFSLEIAYDQPGILILVAAGKGARKAFSNEPGGHRWQRVPPTEKRGRVHTSTVTVAVLNVPTEAEVRLEERDLDWKTCRGSGAGGQHRNKTDSAVQLTHLPTGIMVRCESERSQHQNRATALDLLRSRLAEAEETAATDARNGTRRAQIGGGARGDKRRTIAVQRDQVHDHLTDKRMTVARYLKGELDLLW